MKRENTQGKAHTPGRSLEPIVLPNRFRLSAAALLLSVITIFDPSIMRGMLIAWHMASRDEDKRRKARILCGQNDEAQLRSEAE